MHYVAFGDADICIAEYHWAVVVRAYVASVREDGGGDQLQRYGQF